MGVFLAVDAKVLSKENIPTFNATYGIENDICCSRTYLVTVTIIEELPHFM